MEKFWKLLAGCLAGLACFSCAPQMPDNYTESTDSADIYPDYRDVTVPPNIAPLRFIVDEEADAYAVRISGPDGEWTTDKREVTPGVDEWHDMTARARGRALDVEVFVKHGDGWTRRKPFRIHVAEEDIDPYLSYRLISPSYVTYHDLTINQRDLTNFDEHVIYGNLQGMGVNDAHCINCHSYQNYDPARMQFHVRESYGGTIIAYDGKVTKVNLKTDSLISAGVYPAWHPREKLIAYSVNQTGQTFHTRDLQKIEVQDMRSDLILYDVERNEVTRIKGDPDEMEVFPWWSPDGKYLYYGDQQMARFYTEDDTHYHLTLDFDSDWGFLIRTSTTSWDGGTKFGAPDNQTILELGVPFTLTSASTAANIQFSLPTMYHSHFWTAAFADLNYGKASEADASAAFKAVTEAADKWVGMGVDGFRLDAVKHIYHNAYNDENPTFLKKFYDRMNESYHARSGEGDFYMVGEMLDDAANVAPYYKGLPALFEFSFWYRLRWALQNGIGRYFVKDILEYQPAYRQYRIDYIEATKLSNHDEDRAASELGRVEGRLRVACAVLLTAQGEPYIYQGEELGYWGTKSNGDEYVRTPILWDRAGRELASGSLSGKVDRQMLTESISVEAQAGEENSLLNLYRTFARLRNTYPALAEGAMTKHPVYNENNADGEAVAVWYREKEGERMFVAHNFGDKALTLTLDDALGKAVGLSGEATIKRDGGSTLLTLGAYSSVVFTL